jgi:hypothetical protein
VSLSLHSHVEEQSNVRDGRCGMVCAHATHVTADSVVAPVPRPPSYRIASVIDASFAFFEFCVMLFSYIDLRIKARVSLCARVYTCMSVKVYLIYIYIYIYIYIHTYIHIHR